MLNDGQEDHRSISQKEWSSAEHAVAYLNVANAIPHRTEGEAVLLEYVPKDAQKILDLGTGDGRLLKLLQIDRHQIVVGLLSNNA